MSHDSRRRSRSPTLTVDTATNTPASSSPSLYPTASAESKASPQKCNNALHDPNCTGDCNHKDNKETDCHRLDQRQKQIDLGKNTTAYTNYIQSVPKESRQWSERYGLHPRTPDKSTATSKRGWDGTRHKWRRLLRQWDTIPPTPIIIIMKPAVVVYDAAAQPQPQPTALPATTPSSTIFFTGVVDASKPKPLYTSKEPFYMSATSDFAISASSSLRKSPAASQASNTLLVHPMPFPVSLSSSSHADVKPGGDKWKWLTESNGKWVQDDIQQFCVKVGITTAAVVNNTQH